MDELGHNISIYGAPQAVVPDMSLFFESIVPEESRAQAALAQIADAWKDGYTPIMVDFARMIEAPRPGQPESGSPTRQRLVDFLERQTGQEFGQNLDEWRKWMWKLPYDPHPRMHALRNGSALRECSGRSDAQIRYQRLPLLN